MADDPTPRKKRTRTRIDVSGIDAEPTTAADTPRAAPKAEGTQPRTTRAASQTSRKTSTSRKAATTTPATAASSTPPPSAPFRPTVCDAYLNDEIRELRSALSFTRIGGLVFVVVITIYLGTITNGFAKNLEPTQAATIATGLIAERVNDNIPTFQRYVKEQVPRMIERAPEYVKQEAPRLRQNLESQLDTDIRDYSKQTAPELASRLDAFLTQNKESVGVMLQRGQDPQAQTQLGANLKQMFADYLNETTVNGETLQSKIDQSLAVLTSIDERMRHLAANKNLTENEQRARRAIAILLRKVDESKPELEAIKARLTIDTTPLEGTLQWQSPDEAVFTAPGKPPVTFVRKPGAAPKAAPAASAKK